MDTVILRYDEIALKSPAVRKRFENLLRKNAISMLKKEKRIVKKGGRFFVKTDRPVKAAEILSNLPGVSSVSPARAAAADMREIVANAVELARNLISPGESFAVRATRHGKHSFSTIDINRTVGSEILAAVERVRVDLDAPDHEIFIEVRDNQAYIFTDIIRGPGGLPVGSQGKVIAIFDGRKNNIRAAFLMLKKGCEVVILSEEKLDKAEVKKLLKYHHTIEAYFLPNIKLPPEINPILKPWVRKIFMLKAADALAEKIGAEAIVLPDDLEDISRIGLRGIRMIDSATSREVLRPLLLEGKMVEVDEKLLKELEKTIAKSPGTLSFLPEFKKIVFEVGK